MEYGEQFTVAAILVLTTWIWFKVAKNTLKKTKVEKKSIEGEISIEYDITRVTEFDKITGFIFGIIIFFYSWYFCIKEYGYLFGFGLGWIPSAMSAVAAAFISPYIIPFFRAFFIGIYPIGALIFLIDIFRST